MKFAVDFKPLEWKGAGQALRAFGVGGCSYWITRDGGSWQVEGPVEGFSRRAIGHTIATLIEAQAVANRHHSKALAAWIADIQPTND